MLSHIEIQEKGCEPYVCILAITMCGLLIIIVSAYDNTFSLIDGIAMDANCI